MTDKVEFGKAITTEQAVGAILSRIHTPILGDIFKEGVGYTLHRIFDDDDGIYDLLSAGEQDIANLAYQIYRGTFMIGGMDKKNRQFCIMVMAYLYLGELPYEMTIQQFLEIFK